MSRRGGGCIACQPILGASVAAPIDGRPGHRTHSRVIGLGRPGTPGEAMKKGVQ